MCWVQLPYGSDGERADEGEASHAAALDEAEDDAAELELPPPMKPIQVRRCAGAGGDQRPAGPFHCLRLFAESEPAKLPIFRTQYPARVVKSQLLVRRCTQWGYRFIALQLALILSTFEFLRKIGRNNFNHEYYVHF